MFPNLFFKIVILAQCAKTVNGVESGHESFILITFYRKKGISSSKAFTFVKKTSKNNLTKDDDKAFFMSTKQGFGQFFYASPLSFFLLVLESWVLVLLGIIARVHTRILVVVHFMTCNKYFCPSFQAFVSSQGTRRQCCSSDIKKPF